MDNTITFGLKALWYTFIVYIVAFKIYHIHDFERYKNDKPNNPAFINLMSLTAVWTGNCLIDAIYKLIIVLK